MDPDVVRRFLASFPEKVEPSEDTVAGRLAKQGLTTDQIRAIYLWLGQRGYGRVPGPDLSPFPNPGEPDVPTAWPTEQGMYPSPVYPPGYDEKGRLLRIRPPDEVPKDWTSWL